MSAASGDPTPEREVPGGLRLVRVHARRVVVGEGHVRDDLVERAAVRRVVREGLPQSVDERQERRGRLRREPDDAVRRALARLEAPDLPEGDVEGRRAADDPPDQRQHVRTDRAGAATNGNSSVTWAGTPSRAVADSRSMIVRRAAGSRIGTTIADRRAVIGRVRP